MASKPYNYRDYSALDIKKWLEEKGYDVGIVRKGDVDERYSQWREKQGLPPRPKTFGGDMLHVRETDVYVDLPAELHLESYVMPGIRFNDYPKTDWYEQSKKVYEALKRKFGLKKDEHLDGGPGHRVIKDYEEVQKLT